MSTKCSLMNNKSINIFKKQKNNNPKILKINNTNIKNQTSDSVTTMMETFSSYTEEDEMNLFSDYFFKEKFKTFEEYPQEKISKNYIIHKWYILINVIIALLHMRNFKIKKLSSKDLKQHFHKKEKNRKEIFNNKESKEINDSTNDEHMKYIFDQIKLFQIIEYGYDKYKNEIIDLIKKNNFINDKNYENCTPLYIACINGFENIAKILIDNGADYLLLNINQESVLDISVRWNYYQLTKFLLFYCKWPSQYINNASKLIHNQEIKKLFVNYKKIQK